MQSTEIRTFIAASPDAVFRASLDIDVHLSSMETSRERAIAGVQYGRIGLGETVTWRAKHFGIWWTMTSKVVELSRPDFFVDEQVQGPFRSFRHVHLFRGVEGGTQLTDRLYIESPTFGFIVEPILLVPYLRRLISRRNQIMSEHLVAER